MASASTTRALCWTARILGTLVVALFLLFLVGEGPPRAALLTPLEKLTFAATFILLFGLVLAWRWPGVGGSLCLAGYILCGLFGGARMLLMPPFAIAGFAGLLHVACCWFSDRISWREHHGPRRLTLTLSVLGIAVATAWFWLSMGAHSLEARVSYTPPIAGRWVGTSLLRNRRLDLDITIFPDGTFRGAIGNATITNGRIRPNLKGPIGYLQNKLGEPPFVMLLDLNKSPIAAPGPGTATVRLCFDLRDRQLIGAMHASNGQEDLRDLNTVLHR